MNSITEYLIGTALVILLVLLANPYMLWMPTSSQMAIVLVASLLAIVYGSFVYKEQMGDERETLHRMLAGRTAFLASVASLTLALLVQAITSSIDLWIPATLAVTILAKLATRVWADHHQ